MCHGFKTELEKRDKKELTSFDQNELDYFQESYNESEINENQEVKYKSRRKPISELY